MSYLIVLESMVVIFVRELMMLSNLCVVPGNSASNVQEVIVFETLKCTADVHSFLPIFCILLFYFSAAAEPRALDVEHILHYYV